MANSLYPDFYVDYDLYYEEEYRTIPYHVMFPHFGMCMRHEKSSHAFIPVPRAGSSYINKHLSNDLGWMPYNYNWIKDGKFFSVLRDPYKRWLSGLWAIADPEATDLVNPPVNLLSEESVAKMCDDPCLQNHHTTQQHVFFRYLDTSKITFFNFDDEKFIDNLKHFFENELGIVFSPKDAWHKSDEKTLIKEIIERNSDNLNKIHAWLEPDYQFIRSIKFYEKV